MNGQHLHILWTTGNPLTSNLMVLQYAINCLTQDWWDGVTVIIWGPSAKLLAENEGIQLRVKSARHVGVEFSACSSSARQLGVTQALQEMGIEVKGWGSALSRLLQENRPLLSV